LTIARQPPQHDTNQPFVSLEITDYFWVRSAKTELLTILEFIFKTYNLKPLNDELWP
jgi:hypothetical protein